MKKRKQPMMALIDSNQSDLNKKDQQIENSNNVESSAKLDSENLTSEEITSNSFVDTITDSNDEKNELQKKIDESFVELKQSLGIPGNIQNIQEFMTLIQNTKFEHPNNLSRKALESSNKPMIPFVNFNLRR